MAPPASDGRIESLKSSSEAKEPSVTRYRVTIDGRIYNVEIDDPRARPVTARVSGVAYSVDIDPNQVDSNQPSASLSINEVSPGSTPQKSSDYVRSDASQPIAANAAQTMTAPLPGVVASVVANVGQIVERGDELLTLEAMKMFNIMRSPLSGKVATLHVSEGEQVIQGQPLVTFGPA